MKRCIRAPSSPVGYNDILDEIMSDRYQKRIYGKFMNIETDHAEAWLQGVLDMADVLGVETNGLVKLWEAIQVDGINYAIKALRSI